MQFVGNKAQGRISEQRKQENKARQIFRKTNKCAYQGVRYVFFLGKFGVICLFETFVLRFALLHIYRRIHDFNAINLLTRLRLNFSHLNQQKFRYNFLGTIGPVCSCGYETEATAHFLLRFQNHIISRPKLLKNIYNLDQTQRNYDNDHLIHTVHYSSEKFNFNLNREIIKLTVCYLKDTEQFEISFEISIFLNLLLLLLPLQLAYEVNLYVYYVLVL